MGLNYTLELIPTLLSGYRAKLSFGFDFWTGEMVDYPPTESFEFTQAGEAGTETGGLEDYFATQLYFSVFPYRSGELDNLSNNAFQAHVSGGRLTVFFPQGPVETKITYYGKINSDSEPYDTDESFAEIEPGLFYHKGATATVEPASSTSVGIYGIRMQENKIIPYPLGVSVGFTPPNEPGSRVIGAKELIDTYLANKGSTVAFCFIMLPGAAGSVSLGGDSLISSLRTLRDLTFTTTGLKYYYPASLGLPYNYIVGEYTSKIINWGNMAFGLGDVSFDGINISRGLMYEEVPTRIR